MHEKHYGICNYYNTIFWEHEQFGCLYLIHVINMSSFEEQVHNFPQPT